MTGPGKDVWEGFGILSDEEADDLREHIEDVRKQIDEDFKQRREELFSR